MTIPCHDPPGELGRIRAAFHSRVRVLSCPAPAGIPG
jgi:hypothetical protein